MCRATITVGAALLAALSHVADASPASKFLKLRQRAEHAVQTITGRAQDVTVRWAVDRPTPAMVLGLQVPTQGADASQRAVRFVEQHQDLVGPVTLRPLDVRSTRDLTVVRLQQEHRGLVVLGAVATVALDSGGRVTALHSATRPVTLKDVRPRLTASRALAVASGALHSRASGGVARLAILAGAPARGAGEPRSGAERSACAPPEVKGAPDVTARLVFEVTLPMNIDPRGRRHLVDAHSGEYVGWQVGVIGDGAEVRR